ncbi:MAG: transketolase [Bacilli bacterium]|nr:transketolase [Acholeplasmataceae bacterium]MDY2901924.1 transketolase [Bacilli bacterium]
MNKEIDNKCIEYIRMICLEMIDKAKSGHPGMALGSAPIMHTLFTRFLNKDLNNEWWNRDYFILSGGHASSLLYTILHLSGFDLTMEDLKSFRQLHSKTPGHPEVDVTCGVDASTGPLGQGVATAVGVAIAEEYLRAKTNMINHYTYVLLGDGDMEEGISYEALSIAGHLNLSKLILLYDSNDIQLDGKVNETYNDNTKERMEAMGFNYQLVKDGNDVEAISDAIAKAKQNNKPSLIEIKTIIGYGTSVEGTNKAHGAPIPHDEVVALRNKLNSVAFTIPQDIYDFYKETFVKRSNEQHEKWLHKYNNIDHSLLDKIMKDDMIIDYESIFTKYDENVSIALRKVGGEILKALSQVKENMIGGSADLASSTNVRGNDGTFSVDNRIGRNINFGVREHAMGAICNGLALHHLKSFASTFFVFSDYMKPAIRMSALSKLPVTYIYTHDSIAVGEDGPTHHPIEQLTMLRSIPNVNVIRPGDPYEVNEAYKIAFTSTYTPTVLVLTRQNVPVILKDKEIHVEKGAYIVSDSKKEIPDGILIASGSELALALNVKKELECEDIDVRVVSMPSMYLFDKQSKEYKEQVLPSIVSRKMAIEMSDATHYYKYVGIDGMVYGINKFGISGPSTQVIEEYGFTVNQIKEAFKTLDKVDYIRYIK